MVGTALAFGFTPECKVLANLDWGVVTVRLFPSAG